MSRLTVGAIRKALEGVPDDAIVVGDECDHSYRQLFAVAYTTVLDDGNGQYTEDLFIPEEGDGIGEETEYGVRIRAFVIE